MSNAAYTDDLFDEVLPGDYETNGSLHDEFGVPGLGNKVVRSVVKVKTASGSKQQMLYTPAIRAIVSKLQQIAAELKSVVLEREELIDDMVRALVVRDHILILGPPGTAKTLLARCFCEHIENANFFYWLMNRTTDPSAILGNYDFNKMQKGHYTRVTTGMLPEAHIALLDEIGKSNEPAINIQLSILNERVFHDDGQAIPVPLRTLIGASNEDLDADEFSAVRDRLLYRHTVDYIKDPNNRIKLRELDIERRRNGGKYQPKTKITLNELEELENFVHQVTVPMIVHDQLNKLLMALQNSLGISISDRRDVTMIKVMQAEAALNGRDIVTPADLKALTNILAQRDKDLPEVKKQIDKCIDPWSDALNTQTERIKQVKKDLEATSDPIERRKLLATSKAHLDGAYQQIEQIIEGMKSQGQDPKKAKAELAKLGKYMDEIKKEMLGFDPNITSNMANNMKSSTLDENIKTNMPF